MIRVLERFRELGTILHQEDIQKKRTHCSRFLDSFPLGPFFAYLLLENGAFLFGTILLVIPNR